MKFNYFLILITLLFLSCGGENSSSEGSETMNKALTERNDHKQILSNLQGNWKQTSYPFGTIEFKDRKAKFAEGEGSTTIPQFEQFEISNLCSLVPNAPQLSGGETYLIRANQKYCNKIKLSQDTLFLGGIGRTYSISYVKAGE